MGRRVLASFLSALFLAVPAAGWAQQSPSPATQDLCAELGGLSGLYRTENGNFESRWSFTTASGVARPGDSFLAEHTDLHAVESLGPGAHYVFYGVIDADCGSVSGKWRALFAPSGKRLMTGDFSASLEPGAITITSADDDADQPHGWKNVRYLFVDEPDPPRGIIFAEALEFQSQSGKGTAITMSAQLAFQGAVRETRMVELSEKLAFHGTSQAIAAIEFDMKLEFHGPPTDPRTIAFDDGLQFRGKPRPKRTIDLAESLEFHGEPYAARTIELSQGLVFSGKRFASRITELSEALTFRGEEPHTREVAVLETLEFHHGRNGTRSVVITDALIFYGNVDQSRSVSFSDALAFQGERRPAPQNIALATRLVFPGDTELARAAIITAPPAPTGAGPCGNFLDDSFRTAEFSQSLPESADDITVEFIEKLRAGFTPFQEGAARALETQAACMEKRLESFQKLSALSPHDYWTSNPAFHGETFYTKQIEAARNAALYLRQIAWELQGIEQALKHEEQFFIFDSLDDPQAMKFGLVTDGLAEPAPQAGNAMRMRDFELLQKHAEADAGALVTQRNRYIRRKLAQRFRYLETLLPRTLDGLAAWTQIENHVTRDFMPRVASAISLRIKELKGIHDETQPISVAFSVPDGEFDSYAQEFSRLTQTTGPKIGGGSFDDFMHNKVWYDDFDTWPDAKSLLQ
ncbi:hypothetical protein [Hoeflea sp. TYP-13]|uniref:hypothetical protein n=1 Tax=Hoeflea sp. TYP-13 TaxID=3230023 RepID=UPI0034C64C10